MAFVLAAWTTGLAWGQGGYSGPAILSRTGASPGRGSGDPVKFRAYGSVAGSYSGGLTPIATDKEGKAFDNTFFGATAGFGFYGVHAGKRSSTGVSYGSGYTLYAENGYYNGLNQSLAVNHERQLSPRWSLGAGVGATQMSNVVSPISRSPIADAPFVQQFDPYNELFDNRLYAISGSVGVGYQHSARLTFSMSGGTFTTARRSTALASARGYSSSGQTTYALNRRTQIGAVYSYGNYYFPRGFGRSDINTWMGQFGRVLSPRWTASVGAGLYRAESQRLQVVRIDPAVAAIIGIGNSIQVAHNVNTGLSAQAAVGGRYNRATVSFGYLRGIAPGNGIYLTSRQDAATAAVSLVGTRRWNVGFFGSYGRLTQVFDGQAANQGHMDSYGGGVGFNYRLYSWVHFNSQADYRRVLLDQSQKGPQFSRDRYLLSFGLAFSPGDLPLHIW